MRDDLGVDEGKEVLKVVKPIDAALGDEDMTRFLKGDGADKAALGGSNRRIEGSAFRFVIEDGD